MILSEINLFYFEIVKYYVKIIHISIKEGMNGKKIT